MKYVFHPAALTEYGEAVEFYAQRRVELAKAFINAVEDAIFRIVEWIVGLSLTKIFVDV